MRIYVFGIGAIGGDIAGHLAGLPGLDGGVVARGTHVAAIRDRSPRVMTLERDRARPGRAAWQVVGSERAIGCFSWVGAEVIKPGAIRHDGKGAGPIGEP